MRTNNDKGFSVAATISGRLDCKVTDDFRVAHILSANVPDQVSLLAFGTKACSAGDVPKVPKGQGLAASARSAFYLELRLT